MTAWFSGVYLDFGIAEWTQKSYVRLNLGPDYGKTQWFSIRRANLKWGEEYEYAVKDLEKKRQVYEDKHVNANAKQKRYHMVNMYSCKERDDDDEEEEESDSGSENQIR